MNAADKIAKATRIKTKLIDQKEMAEDFAEAMGLYMVLTGDCSVKRARMPVFLAGENGADKFRKQILAA